MFRPLQRLRLQRAARRYAGHDWPVIPGARLCGDRFDCDQVGCPTVTCHPAMADWEQEASLDPARIARWWQHTDYGVLLATGHSFEVLEVAGPLGWHLAREARGPVAVAPPQRWFFLMRAGDDLVPDLAENSSVVLHRAGSWIPAPPTPLPDGGVRWVTRPGEFAWEPADPARVQRTAARILRAEAISLRSASRDLRIRSALPAPATGRPFAGTGRPVLGPGGDHQPRQVWRLNNARRPLPTAE
jgi:hypothetical protein